MIIETCENPKYYNRMWRACNQCPKCKARRQREWTLRGKLEALNHKNETIFATFTYDDKHMVKTAKWKENKFDQGGTLVKRDATLLIKRLRKYLGKNHKKIKYILCGEYGEKYFRPHYHAIFYGINPLEISDEEWRMIWKKGNVQIKPVTSINQIAYVVGYINKKITDTTSKEHYTKNGRVAPFQRQSQKIGLEWSKKNEIGWVKAFKTCLNGKETSIPRYFIKKVFEKEGRKIKLENTITKVDIDEFKMTIHTHKSNNYKVFINPDGEMSAQILEQEKLQQLTSMIDFARRNGITADKLIEDINIRNQERLAKIKAEWEDVQNLTQSEIKLKYEHETIKIIDRKSIDPQTSKIPCGINKETWHNINQNAIILNYKTSHKAKKRNGIEKDEEFKEYILSL